MDLANNISRKLPEIYRQENHQEGLKENHRENHQDVLQENRQEELQQIQN